MKGKDIRDCEQVNGVWRVAANGHFMKMNDARAPRQFWTAFFACILFVMILLAVAFVIAMTIESRMGGVPMA